MPMDGMNADDIGVHPVHPFYRRSLSMISRVMRGGVHPLRADLQIDQNNQFNAKVIALAFSCRPKSLYVLFSAPSTSGLTDLLS